MSIARTFLKREHNEAIASLTSSQVRAVERLLWAVSADGRSSQALEDKVTDEATTEVHQHAFRQGDQAPDWWTL